MSPKTEKPLIKSAFHALLRINYVFIPFVLMIMVVAVVTACTGSSTSTRDPRLDTLEQRVNALENQVGLLEDVVGVLGRHAELQKWELRFLEQLPPPPTQPPTPTLTAEERARQAAEAANTELSNVQAAMDAAIADLRLLAVDARSTCSNFSSTGGCGLTGGTVPANFLYPSYLRIQAPGGSPARTYSWDATGLVSTP